MNSGTTELEKLFAVLTALFACSTLVGGLVTSAFYPHSILLQVFFVTAILMSISDHNKFRTSNAIATIILMFFVLVGTETFASMHLIKALMLFIIAVFIVISDTRKFIFHNTIIIVAKLHFVFHLLQFFFLYFGSEALVQSGQRTFYPLLLGFRAPGIFDEPSYASGFYMLATASVLFKKIYQPQFNLRNDVVIFVLGSLMTLSTGIILHITFLFWLLCYRKWQFYVAAIGFIMFLMILTSGFSFSVDAGDAARARIITSAINAFTDSTSKIIFGLGIGGVETMFLKYNIYGSTTNSGLIDIMLAMGLIGAVLGILYFSVQVDIENKYNFFHLCFFILPCLFSINYLQLIFWVYLTGFKRSHNAS